MTIFKLGVVGQPIKHSLSPIIHQEFSIKTGIQLQYEAYEVPPEALDGFIANFFKDGGHGLNITLPHKKACIASAHVLSKDVELLSAANTLTGQEGGKKIVAESTDGPGFIRDCEDKNIQIFNKNIIILGAGGASQSIIPSIAKLGPAKLVIDNRTKHKTNSLLNQFPEIPLLDLDNFNGPIDMVINATSAGLTGSFDWDIATGLDKNTIFYDLSYGPSETPFLQWASLYSNHKFDGIGMLIFQAAYSFELWFDIAPPTENIKEILFKNND